MHIKAVAQTHQSGVSSSTVRPEGRTNDDLVKAFALLATLFGAGMLVYSSMKLHKASSLCGKLLVATSATLFVGGALAMHRHC
jgi:hypothetical protein